MRPHTRHNRHSLCPLRRARYRYEVAAIRHPYAALEVVQKGPRPCRLDFGICGGGVGGGGGGGGGGRGWCGRGVFLPQKPDRGHGLGVFGLRIPQVVDLLDDALETGVERGEGHAIHVLGELSRTCCLLGFAESRVGEGVPCACGVCVSVYVEERWHGGGVEVVELVGGRVG